MAPAHSAGACGGRREAPATPHEIAIDPTLPWEDYRIVID